MCKVIKCKNHVKFLLGLGITESNLSFYINKLQLLELPENREAYFSVVNELVTGNGISLDEYKFIRKSFQFVKDDALQICTWMMDDPRNNDFIIKLIYVLSVQELYGVVEKQEEVIKLINELKTIDTESLDEDSPLKDVLGDLDSIIKQAGLFDAHCKKFSNSLDTQLLEFIDSWYIKFSGYIYNSITVNMIG